MTHGMAIDRRTTRTNNADAKPTPERRDRKFLSRAPFAGGRGCQGWLPGMNLDFSGSTDQDSHLQVENSVHLRCHFQLELAFFQLKWSPR